MKKRKMFIITLISIMVIALLFVLYYFYPLPAKNIIEGYGQINRIEFGLYSEDGPFDVYEVEISEQSDIHSLLKTLDSTTYNKRLGYKDIANDGRYVDVLVFYGENHANYHLELNDSGYIIVNHKTYS